MNRWMKHIIAGALITALITGSAAPVPVVSAYSAAEEDIFAGTTAVLSESPDVLQDEPYEGYVAFKDGFGEPGENPLAGSEEEIVLDIPADDYDAAGNSVQSYQTEEHGGGILYIGKKYTATVGNISGGFTWKSSKSKIASVKKDKKNPKLAHITPKKPGTTIISLKMKKAKKIYTWTYTVVDPVSLDTEEAVISEGQDLVLDLDYAYYGKVKWSSGKKKVATVKDGIVTAKKPGVTTITAKYKGRKYKCKVTVLKDGGANVVSLSKTPKTVTSSSVAPATLGSLDSDGFSVQLPAGTFENGTPVTAKAKGNAIDLSIPGTDHTRLQEPVILQFKLDRPVPENELDKWMGVYYFKGKEYYTTPDLDQLRKGVLQYETYHFSKEGAKKLSDAEAKLQAGYRSAVNEVTKDVQANVASKAIEESLEAVIKKLKLEGRSKQIAKLLGKSGKLIKLARAASEGSESDFYNEASQLVLEALVNEGCKDFIGQFTGDLPEVYSAIKDGRPEDALKAISESFVNNMPYMKIVNFTIAVTQTSIDFWADYESEAAYKAFYGLSADGEGGYDKKGVKDQENWDIMEAQDGAAAWLREMNKQAFRDYAGAMGKRPSELTKDEQDKIRAMVKNNILEQFRARRAQDAKIDEKAAENKAIIDAFDKQGLLTRGEGGIAFGEDDDMEQRIYRLMNIRKSVLDLLDGQDFAFYENQYGSEMSEKERIKLNNKRVAQCVRIWIQNAWTEGGNPVKGRAAVQKALALEYGMGVSLSKTTASVGIDETVSLSLLGMPEGTSSPRWYSTDSKIATVDADGNVKGVMVGDCQIIAKYGKRDYICSVNVTLGNAEVSYRFNKSEVTFTEAGASEEVYLYRVINGDSSKTEIVPPEEWDGGFTKNDRDEAIDAEETYKGILITARKNGTATISVSYEGNSYSCKVTVQLNNTVTLSQTDVNFSSLEDPPVTVYLCTVTDGVSERIKLKKTDWQVSAGKVIKTEKLDDGGLKIIPTGEGDAEFMCEYEGVEHFGYVHVKLEQEEYGISTDKLTFEKPSDQAQTLYLYKKVGDKTPEKVEDAQWSISGDAATGEESDGGYKVTPKAKGTATVTCKYKDLTFSCSVTVNGEEESDVIVARTETSSTRKIALDIVEYSDNSNVTGTVYWEAVEGSFKISYPSPAKGTSRGLLEFDGTGTYKFTITYNGKKYLLTVNITGDSTTTTEMDFCPERCEKFNGMW